LGVLAAGDQGQGFSTWLEDRLSGEMDFSSDEKEIWIDIFLWCSFWWFERAFSSYAKCHISL
jgi:hypothetical protein